MGVAARDGGTETEVGVATGVTSKLGVDVEAGIWGKPEESTEDDRLAVGRRRNLRWRNEGDEGGLPTTGVLTLSGVGVVGDSVTSLTLAVAGSAGGGSGLRGEGGLYSLESASASSSSSSEFESPSSELRPSSSNSGPP